MRVFCLGVWDMFHMGHLQLLLRAYEEGKGLYRTLIVGVVQDEAVRRQKGDGRPIIPFDERIAIIKALGCVHDVVALDDFFIPKDLINLCDFVVVGEDQHHIKNLSDIPADKRLNLSRYAGTSTSEIIKRIKNDTHIK